MIPMSMWWYNKGKRKDGTFCPTQKESKRLHDVRNLLETLQGFEDVNNDHRQSFRKFLNSIDFIIYLYRFFLQKNTSRFNSNSKTSSYQWTNSTTFTIFSQMVILRRQCYWLQQHKKKHCFDYMFLTMSMFRICCTETTYYGFLSISWYVCICFSRTFNVKNRIIQTIYYKTNLFIF